MSSKGFDAQRFGALRDAIHHVQLAWRLLRDGRVPLGFKLIPFLALAYILLPWDFLPDPVLGLGQLDDLALILLGIELFVNLCPTELVRQHSQRLRQEAGAATPATEQVVESAYRVWDADERR
jgi:uncharacterized membrane protein YkvA (DUF1232 family)